MSIMRNRQRHEIVRDILIVCNGGSIISKVMFHSYLSHAQAKAYLSELIESGLIERDIFDTKKYLATNKGLEYLARLETMSDMLGLELKKAKVIA
jgi:predicted transcriptional regulator